MSETKTIHVRVWSGSMSARITEMQNAGKRGKTCRTLRLAGHYKPDDEVRWFFQETLAKLSGEESLDDVALMCRALKAGCPTFEFYEETIRGIDAPREVLTANVEGKFFASADEDGVSLGDLTDRFNEPRAYSRGSGSRAYGIAKKVWADVQAQATFYDAIRVLSGAGLDIHSYCGMD